MTDVVPPPKLILTYCGEFWAVQPTTKEYSCLFVTESIAVAKE